MSNTPRAGQALSSNASRHPNAAVAATLETPRSMTTHDGTLRAPKAKIDPDAPVSLGLSLLSPGGGTLRAHRAQEEAFGKNR